MPRKKYDADGKLFAWSDEGFMLRYILDQAYGNMSGYATTKEQKRIDNIKINKIDPLEKSMGYMAHNHGVYGDNEIHGAENSRARLENKSLVVASYYEPGDYEKVKKFIDELGDFYKKKAQQVPEGKSMIRSAIFSI